MTNQITKNRAGNSNGFLRSAKIEHTTKTAQVYRFNTNTKTVEMYPATTLPADAPRFLFSTPREIHLYECDAHPDGVGVIK